MKYSIDEQLEERFINLFSRKNDKHEAHLSVAGGRFHEDGEAAGSDKESDDDDRNSSESSDDDELEENDTMMIKGDGSSNSQQGLRNNFKEHVELRDGRIRRKAVFGNDDSDADEKVSYSWKPCVR